jgi:hypothetical protein
MQYLFARSAHTFFHTREQMAQEHWDRKRIWLACAFGLHAHLACTRIRLARALGLHAHLACTRIWLARAFGLQAHLVCRRIWFAGAFGLQAHLVCRRIWFASAFGLQAQLAGGIMIHHIGPSMGGAQWVFDHQWAVRRVCFSIKNVTSTLHNHPCKVNQDESGDISQKLPENP